MSYIDAVVVAVPNRNRELYTEYAERMAAVVREHGALGLTECWGEEVHDGEMTSFPRAVRCRDDETVVLAWIMWPSRAVRDEGMPKVMADPRVRMDDHDRPFDGKRLIHGTFEVIVGGPGGAGAHADTMSARPDREDRAGQSPGDAETRRDQGGSDRPPSG